MKRSSFAKQCLDLLHSHEAKQWITPFVNMIVGDLYPYVYIGLVLVCVIIVLLGSILGLLLFVVKQQGVIMALVLRGNGV